jgi:superfamily I DNA/RNA helicase
VVELQRIIARTKITKQSLREVHKASLTSIDYEVVKRVFDDYGIVLTTSNSIDFEDMLVMGLAVLKAVPEAPETARLQHILVDELYVLLRILRLCPRLIESAYCSQDTGSLQYASVVALHKGSGSPLTVVGDPDQTSELLRNASYILNN